MGKIGLRFDLCNLHYMVRVFRRFIPNANRFLKTSLEYVDRVNLYSCLINL